MKFTTMKKVIEILLYLWQLPQNIVGFLFVLVLQPEGSFEFDGHALYYASRMRGGISLGRYIIVSDKFKDYNGRTEQHEIGHAFQSLYLGPLYLLVIGLPSLLWAAWWNRSMGVSYYSFYTEKWADRLGNVERDDNE